MDAKVGEIASREFDRNKTKTPTSGNRYILLGMSDDSPTSAEPIDRQLYLEHRKSLVELGVAQIGLFDKTLILLSTAALGASALFVDTFIGENPMQMQPILGLSWLAFGLCMLANLLSYWTSWKDMETERNAWDAKYLAGDAGIPHANGWRTVTSSLNACAFLFFMAGLFTLLAFCFSNLGGKT